MAAPGVFGVNIHERVANVFHLGGALIIVMSVFSMGEPLRLMRYLNVLLGLAVAAFPWFLQDSPLELRITGLVLGLVVAGLSIPVGPKTQNYAGWDEYIK
ncbi:SPW repeat domain-containing protein [Pontibacter harenae]|uniref:SPW repeat domain-containing protein n=1 Tax=Pontibacter harenae TaxID=2894083 RepID=UPI001E2C757C|nr:hypothetical protein [Pontibacter harenae]MCC9167450.1 hypothetical protein [Pontibacter harenae]